MENDDAMTPETADSMDIVTGLCAAISGLETGGEASLHLEAEPSQAKEFDIPLASSSGRAALAIDRLDGKDLARTGNGIDLVDRLQRAEAVIAAVESLLGLEFAPDSHDMTNMAAMLKISAADADGDVRHSLILGLDSALLNALPRRDISPVLRRNLPIQADILISLPAAAGVAEPGDIMLLGGSGPSAAAINAPEPLGTFGTDLDIGGCRIARAAEETGAGPQYRIRDVRLTLQALQAAKQGAPLILPADLSGQVTLPDGAQHPAQLVAIGDTVGIRIIPSTQKAA